MPKKTLQFPALVLFGIFAIYGFMLYPLLVKVSNDMVLSGTPLYEIVNILYHLIQWLGVGAAFGFVIHSIYRFSTKKSISLFVLIGGAFLFKYVAYVISYSIMNGSLNVTSRAMDLYRSLLFTYLGDCLFVALAALLTHIWTTRLRQENRAKEASCKRLGLSFEPVASTLPFSLKRPFSRRNPLLRAAFWGTLAYAVLQALSFLVGEILYGLSKSYYFADFFLSLYDFFTRILIPTALCYLITLICIKSAEWNRVRLETQQTEEETESA